VLMMHRSDGHKGGAQIQMGRIKDGLTSQGFNASILCRDACRADSILMPASRSERWIKKITQKVGLNDIHLISSFRVKDLDAFVQTDILDIHCTHSETFSYLALPSLCNLKPTVFTVHDMWPITGHCHASLDCDKWKSGCGKCPYLEIDPSVKRDATAIEWKLKQWIYKKSSFSVIVPSRWMRNQVASSMLHRHPIHVIPHGVDTDLYKPLERNHCRSILGIPQGKMVILCGMECVTRRLKGIHLLIDAVNSLPLSVRKDCVLVFFGGSNPITVSQFRIPVVNLGYLNEDYEKAIAYSCADLLIQPSIAESFGLVALESISCGTPVVAFNVDAIPEIVRPGITGVLANSVCATSLCDSIRDILAHKDRLRALQRSCRDVALTEYRLSNQVSRYAEVYRETIERFRGIKYKKSGNQ
jgi:glycosyltransferase involved in cell wall biosynthesis